MITQKFTFVCAHCGTTQSRSYRIASIGSSALMPELPDGWVRIGIDEYCPKHKITVNVDGCATIVCWNENDSVK